MAQQLTQTGRITNVEWEQKRPILYDIYIRQSRPLHEVVSIMRQQHHFSATKKTFKSHFKRWGWRKSENEKVMVRKQQRYVYFNAQPRQPPRAPAVIEIPERLLLKLQEYYSKSSSDPEYWNRYDVTQVNEPFYRLRKTEKNPPALTDPKFSILHANVAARDCWKRIQDGRPSHAVAYMNKACSYLPQALEHNPPNLIRQLGTVLLRCPEIATDMRRTFLRFLASYAAIARQKDPSDPFAQCASLLMKCGEDPNFLKVLLEVDKISLEKILSPLHTISVQSRLNKRVVNRSTTTLSEWKLLLQEIDLTLGRLSLQHFGISIDILRMLTEAGRYQEAADLYYGDQAVLKEDLPVLQNDISDNEQVYCALHLTGIHFKLGNMEEGLVFARSALKYLSNAPTSSEALEDLPSYEEMYVNLGLDAEAQICRGLLLKNKQEEDEWVQKELEAMTNLTI